ncbi:MAG: cell division protein FtsA [bacterium]
MKNKKETIISIDIGNHKCRCTLFNKLNNTLTILKMGTSKTNGLTHTTITDQHLFQESLHTCIKSCQSTINKKHCQIIINSPIEHPHTHTTTTAPPLLNNIKTNIQNALKDFSQHPLIFLPAGQAIYEQGLTHDEKTKGCILIDIGAYNSKIKIIQNKLIQEVVSVPIGGYTITKDLSICLKTNEETAEKLKILSCNLEENPPQKEITHNNETFDNPLIQKIIKARVSEWLQLIQKKTPKHPFIIYGGGALLKNKSAFLKNKYNISCRRLEPTSIHKNCNQLTFATSIANGIYAEKQQLLTKKSTLGIKKWFQNWL